MLELWSERRFQPFDDLIGTVTVPASLFCGHARVDAQWYEVDTGGLLMLSARTRVARGGGGGGGGAAGGAGGGAEQGYEDEYEGEDESDDGSEGGSASERGQGPGAAGGARLARPRI